MIFIFDDGTRIEAPTKTALFEKHPEALKKGFRFFNSEKEINLSEQHAIKSEMIRLDRQYGPRQVREICLKAGAGLKVPERTLKELSDAETKAAQLRDELEKLKKLEKENA